ncbi:hypothetical protein AE925_16680 [Xanthomonas arboricola]|uniref:ParB/RepB/Spo0J family partition protein n=1 Tax=Xanthomonas arboricola TaxID=56448 RepID=UPI00069DE4DB|nr:ParB/RepB/Spo0J family partition protein [Xanthomonas arboricola]KOB15804.1 hypothetical protein AE925_16680 [Xanthomonas arboricola]KOB42468.1 hypothetical protein AE931_16950 [Xanthomonas arboricola]
MQTNTITQDFPIAKLDVSPRNVRFSTEPPSSIVEAYADNIVAVGLIHDLTVELVDGVPLVVAGKTRLRALQFLVSDGRRDPADLVTCKIVDSSVAEMLSLSENVQRQEMHPADEFKAFAKQVANGHSIESIALAFGTSAQTVEKRLKLAAVAPALVESYRQNNHPSLQQLMALSITDDHARQLAVWNERKVNDWMCTPTDLRECLSTGHIDALVDRRTKLVTVADYQAAGGHVQTDLFNDRVYLLDSALFSELVVNKMSELAASLQNEGWSWVEVFTDGASNAIAKFGRTAADRGQLTDDQQSRAAELQAQLDAAAAELHNYFRGDVEDDAVEERLRRINDDAQSELNLYYGTLDRFSQEQMSFAGAAVTLAQDGAVRIERGLVRQTDRRALDEAARAGRLKNGVTGGRETQDAGRKADNVSEALQRALLGHRIVAVQSEVAKNPRVAKVVMACWSVGQILGRARGVPTDLGITGGYGLRSRLPQLGETVKAKEDEFAAGCRAEIAGLPTDPAELWDALMLMTEIELDHIVALGVAKSIEPSEEHTGVTAKMLDALSFNMADHFVVDEANYLSRVSKKLVMGALTEADCTVEPGLDTMSKGDLVTTAARLLGPTRWVPPIIRSPDVVATAPSKKQGKAAPKGSKAAVGPKQGAAAKSKATAA